MKTRTNGKAGGGPGKDKIAINHSETLLRDNSQSLKFKTALRAGKKAA